MKYEWIAFEFAREVPMKIILVGGVGHIIWLYQIELIGKVKIKVVQVE